MNARALAALLLVATVSCSGDDAPEGPRTERPPAGAALAADGSARGARGNRSVSLAATDVATVVRRTVEAGLPVTGELRPIEVANVRARLEGDILTVHAREGQRVRRGELLAVFEAGDQTSLARSAEADVAAARTELSTAQWNLDQSRELFREGAIPKRDVKNAEQQVAAARARLAAADARLRATATEVRDTRVVAPFDGIVETRSVAPGEHVARGAQLFTVVRTDVLELAAAVPARSAGDLQPGQTVHFTADGRRFDGRIARVSPTISPQSRAITVFVQVPNANGALRGGTFASGRVISREARAALVVPTAAIRQAANTGAPFVWRIQGGTLERAEVALGLVDEAAGVAEVQQGLAENDQVVVGNVGLLGDGMSVQIVGERRGP